MKPYERHQTYRIKTKWVKRLRAMKKDRGFDDITDPSLIQDWLETVLEDKGDLLRLLGAKFEMLPTHRCRECREGGDDSHEFWPEYDRAWVLRD